MLPPLITFISDIFHPLVTPLTTYTYTTGSRISDTVSATDDERLPPGGFCLRYGFPQWFGRAEKGAVSPALAAGNASRPQDAFFHSAARVGKHGSPGYASPIRISQQNLGSHNDRPLATLDVTSPSIIEILGYVKSAFDDETTLDALPMEAAGNPGAWNAWQAHRKSGLQDPEIDLHDSSYSNFRKQAASSKVESQEKPPDEWSWDGVWEERVKKGVDTSISDPVLYGSAAAGGDLVGRSIHSGR